MKPLFIVLIVLIALLLCVGTFFKTPIGRGMIGEFRVKRVIGKTKEGERYILNNVMIVEDGKSSQIDHIVINRNGVFVIETKNYSGRIYGKDNQQEWTQVLKYGKMKNHFYNPVKQNATHIYRLLNILPEGTPINSVIVFVRDNIRHIKSSYVYNLRGMKRFINKSNGVELSNDQMKEIYDLILAANDSAGVSSKQHIKEIHDMQNNIKNNICPRCGAKLVIRHSKNGDFYGCSNYPKCQFTKKVGK